MDSSLSEKYLPILRKHWLSIGLAFFGLIFLVYGLIALSAPKKDNPDILFQSTSDQVPLVKISPSPQKTITIDVEGGVLKPGVYKLAEDSRAQDALIAAGGLSSSADRAVVAKALNLAAKLIDGGKIYIPVVGDTAATALAAGGSSDVLGAQTGLININTASATDLDSLPGIGQVTAEKIISNRPYGSADELLSKKIVSSKVFGEIKDKISIY